MIANLRIFILILFWISRVNMELGAKRSKRLHIYFDIDIVGAESYQTTTATMMKHREAK